MQKTIQRFTAGKYLAAVSIAAAALSSAGVASAAPMPTAQPAAVVAASALDDPSVITASQSSVTDQAGKNGETDQVAGLVLSESVRRLLSIFGLVLSE